MEHVWMTARVAFWLLCIVGATGLLLWLIGCLIGAHLAANQRRAQAQRKGHDFRVGGSLSP